MGAKAKWVKYIICELESLHDKIKPLERKTSLLLSMVAKMWPLT